MNGLRDHLRRDDPLVYEPPPSDLEITAMRRRVLDVARAPRRRFVVVPPVVAGAAVALVCTAIGAVVHLSARQDMQASGTSLPVAHQPTAEEFDLRRVYFRTPSGVQVIWQFESE